MRLWSIHPQYLDTKGLLAVWREGLLAQKVLMGKTKGYKNHPQLQRFKIQQNPHAAISFYLKEVYEEAKARGYNFSEEKILISSPVILPINVSKGQVDYEMAHLCQKLMKRDPLKHKSIMHVGKIKTHPLFKIVPGAVEAWEKVLPH